MTTNHVSDEIMKAYWDAEGGAVEGVAVAIAEAMKVEHAALLEIVGGLYDEAPSAPFDNGGTQDGWRMACHAFEKAIAARTSLSQAK